MIMKLYRLYAGTKKLGTIRAGDPSQAIWKHNMRSATKATKAEEIAGSKTTKTEHGFFG